MEKTGAMEKIDTMEAFWAWAETVPEGFLFAMLTDQVVFERWPLAPDGKEAFRKKEGKLLDIRLFNEQMELRMFRGDMGGTLRGRVREDKERDLDLSEYFDEDQYLALPPAGFANAKIKIRNYLAYYEETGQAYVRDWRLAGLFQEKG